MTPTDSQAAVLACADPRLGAALEYVLATPGKQLRHVWLGPATNSERRPLRRG